MDINRALLISKLENDNAKRKDLQLARRKDLQVGETLALELGWL